MNIFVLDSDPILAAQLQCDKHVVKMCLETAQLLCAAFEPGIAFYKRTHYTHPCSIWTRASLNNYMWLINHGLALCEEYTYRYGKVHKSMAIIHWCRDNLQLIKFNSIGLTDFAICMPDDAKIGDAVDSYQNYYRKYKANIAVWTNRPIPNWFQTKFVTL